MTSKRCTMSLKRQGQSPACLERTSGAERSIAPSLCGRRQTVTAIAFTAMQPDFDLRALYEALDVRRRERDMSWLAVAREVGRFRTRGVAASTITGLRDKRVGEGDGILQMLLWLGRTPESFVPGRKDADSDHYRLPAVPSHQVLRWDTRALFLALDAQRLERQLTWAEVAREIGGHTPAM